MMKKNDRDMVPLDSLEPDPKNARVGRVDVIAASLAKYGQRMPVLVERATRKIVKGNHTCLAARRLGWTEVWVLWDDGDPALLQEYALADNRSTDGAGWDDLVLSELALEIDLTTVPGFDADFLDGLASRLAATGLAAPADPEGSAINLRRKQPVVRLLVAVPDVAVVEQALRAAGTPNRSEALMAVCREYLAGRGNV